MQCINECLKIYFPHGGISRANELRYITGDIGHARRWALRRFMRELFSGRCLVVPLSLICDQYAFSFGPGGWHHWVSIAREYLHDNKQQMRDMEYYRFFANIRARYYSDLMTVHDSALRQTLPRLKYEEYPWGCWNVTKNADFDPDRYILQRSNQTFMWYEKSEDLDAVLRKELIHTIEILKSIVSYGYSVRRSLFNVPVVVPMIRSDGAVKFIRQDGAHRLACLAALGRKHCLVRIHPNYPSIRETHAATWYNVARGLLSEKEGRRIFSLYFELDGRERLKACLSS